MKKKYLTSLIMLGTATLGMVGLVVASQKDGGYLNATGEGTTKTFTFDKTTHITGATTEDESGSITIATYQQTVNAQEGTLINVDGDYLNTSYESVDLNSADFFVTSTAVSGREYNVLFELNFYIHNITQASWTFDASSSISDLTFFEYKDGNQVNSWDGLSATSCTCSGDNNSFSMTSYGYSYFGFKSITFTYTC